MLIAPSPELSIPEGVDLYSTPPQDWDCPASPDECARLIQSSGIASYSSAIHSIQFSTITLAAVLSDELLGVGVSRLAAQSAMVDYLAVEQKQRKRGYGSLILRSIELQAKNFGAISVGLDAVESAQQFYIKQGYAGSAGACLFVSKLL